MFDVFAQIVEHLNKHYGRDMEFIICGKCDFSHLAEKLSHYDNVKWLGYVTDIALVEVYQKAHVLVAPSRYGYEEFLFTSIEAQACGTPVIASDILGPRDNVINGRTGFLVRPSPEEFVKRIMFLKNLWQGSRETYEQYSKNARENALAYDWSIIVDKLEKMFTEVSRL